jgi:twinkle protein
MTRLGKLVGYKKRLLPKAFLAVGEGKGAELFGQQKCTADGKMLIITEGEEDALAVHQAFLNQGKSYRVVSLTNGANINSIKTNLEFIESFESVVLCFDNDEPGQKAAEAACKLLRPGKGKIATLPLKDASDMLMDGRETELTQAIWNAKPLPVEGIINSRDTWELYKNKKDVPYTPFPPFLGELNNKIYGMALGTITLLTSGTGSGKSSIFREIEYDMIMNGDSKVGIIHLEEPISVTVEHLMAIHLNKRINLPDVKVSEEEQRAAWEATCGSGKVEFYDYYGSVEEEALINRIRYMALAQGCKWIFLDHISIAVSEFSSDGGTNGLLESLITKLGKLVVELNIWIGIISHLRKVGSGSQNFEEGIMPTLDDLKGASGLKQVSWTVLAVARNQQHENPKLRNVSQIAVLKDRLTGRTGPAGFAYFNPDTGRMEEWFEPELDEGEDYGGSASDDF